METLFWKMGWRTVVELAFTAFGIVCVAVTLPLFTELPIWVPWIISAVAILSLLLRIQGTRAFTPSSVEKLIVNKLDLPTNSTIEFVDVRAESLKPRQAGWTSYTNLRYDLNFNPYIVRGTRLRAAPPPRGATLIVREGSQVLHLVRFMAFTPVESHDQELTALRDSGLTCTNPPRFHGF